MGMTRISGYKALDVKVLAVATVDEMEDWAAYIGAVAGKNHDKEAPEVARSGSKLPRELAELIFPNQALNYMWRE